MKRALVFSLCVCFAAVGVRAEGPVALGESDFAGPGDAVEKGEPVFLSLTRFSEPMGHVPAGVSVVRAEEIRRLNAQNVGDVLERLPSVEMTKSGTMGSFSSLRMRGAPSSAHVQVLVDDLPLGGVAAQYIDLSQIPVEDIDRIEVIRGGSSVLYGANTTGGVVHIITKRHTDPRPVSTVGIEGRSFKTQIYRGSLGAQGHGFDGRVTAVRSFTDGFQKNADGTGTSVGGNGGLTFANGARVSVSASRYDNDTGDPQGTSLPLSAWDGSRERDAANPLARIEQNGNAGRVRAVVPLGKWAQLHSVSFGSDQIYNARPRKGAGAAFHQRTQLVGNDTRLQFPGGFLIGASYERDRQETLGVAAGHVVDWGAYVQQTVTLGRLDLVPAARVDQHSAFGNTYNPRLTVVYRAAERLKLSANAGRSFRAPSFLELYYHSASFNGNSSLRPETAWSYDAGFQVKTSARTTAGVTGFYTRLRDRIAANLTTYQNAPRAEQSGVEFEGTGRAGPFTGRVNCTYTRAIGNSLGSTRFVPLRLTPRRAANADLTWDLSKKYSLTHRLRYVGKQFQADDESGAVLPPFAVWDVRLTRRILAAEVYFGADNVLNRRYAEGFGNDPATFATTLLPQPRRTFVGGITLRFVD